jgi:hypothetical protein
VLYNVAKACRLIKRMQANEPSLRAIGRCTATPVASNGLWRSNPEEPKSKLDCFASLAMTAANENPKILSPMPSFISRACIFAACLLLTACAEKVPAPPPLPAPPLTPSAREQAAAHTHVDPVDAALMISQYRAAHGLGPVSADPTLQRLAQAQADAMAAQNVLSHTIAGTLTQRFDAAHLSRATAVENVSAGYFSLANVMAGWRKSPPHNANLLSPKMRRLGIATAYAPGTRYLVYWALDMSN